VKRRELLAGLGGAAVAARPLLAGAQTSAPVVGYLYSGAPETSAHLLAAFRKGLNEAGYVEGHNVAIEYRFAHNEDDRLAELAADLVRRRVAVIVTPGSPVAAIAAKSATTTIPIVFRTGADPVQTGLVASLGRPGGNVTGLNSMSGELGATQIGLLHELFPGATRFAVLVNPSDASAAQLIKDVQAAVSSIGREATVLSASTNLEIDAAFASLEQTRANALLIGPQGLFNNRRFQLVTLAAHHRMPALYPVPEFTEVGGLMSYGASAKDQFRQVGIYAGRILSGEKPTDLPVLRATKFELVINLQTARTLGIAIPNTLLVQADEVIE
jgi:putative ABC transport system substrate-binding protein